MNNFLYEIASFMVLRQSTVWRWSHARHHSDTIIRGRDPEIAVPRPPNFRKIILSFFGISSAIPEIKKIFCHAFGQLDPQVATYIPKHIYKTVFFKARIYIFIYLLVIALAIIYKTILPLMFIGLPTLLGTWLMPIYGLTQHTSLQENVLDHRLNCRTVYMNRIHRYLYWNMNYHIEHYMFPLVPYHALPKLHELMKADCPKPYSGIIDAWKEIIPALIKQHKGPMYFVERKLPANKTSRRAEVKNKFFGIAEKLVDEKIQVCTIDDLPMGEIIRFDFNQKTYAIYRTDKDQLYATEGICSHGNAHLSEGVIIGDVIECAKHNGRFSLKDGSPRRSPVCVGINTYQVFAENGNVILFKPLNETKKVDNLTYRVMSNYNVTAFIKELVLEPLRGKILDYKPGQYIQLSIPPHQIKFEDFQIGILHTDTWRSMDLFSCFSENTLLLKRNYSMATNPDVDKQLRFTIRIALPAKKESVPASSGSSYVFNLRSGDQIELNGPFGDFLVKPTHREMVYIGGGAGMAPLHSHLTWLFETEKTTRKVSFWYGARSRSDLYYTDYFEKLQAKTENFAFHLALSEPKEEDNWDGHIGYINEMFYNEYLKKTITQTKWDTICAALQL